MSAQIIHSHVSSEQRTRLLTWLSIGVLTAVAFIFAYFVNPAAPMVVPGAAFDGSALVFLLALAIAARTMTSHESAQASVQTEPA